MPSPVPAVSNHLLPPAGPCPVVTRLVFVSKTTRRMSWAWGWGCFSGDMGTLLVFPPGTNLESLFLVYFLISHPFQYSILASPSLDLTSALSSHGCSEILKILDQRVDEKQLRASRNITTYCSKESYIGGYLAATVLEFYWVQSECISFLRIPIQTFASRGPLWKGKV